MTATATDIELRLDPIDFEILRHRLWAINEEAATTLKRVSGSPLANEANDFNTAIFDPIGDVVAVARYSISKATTMSAVVQDILANYQQNPGIRPGDAFICNDAYVAVQHQNDVALVMPFFLDGELLGWVGAEVHQADVGGPVPGNVQVGAKDIWGEAPMMPPLKIVEGGVIRNDVEREYLRRSRTPDLLALDLRAQVAACNVATRRLGEIGEKKGADTIRDIFRDILVHSEHRFRARLLELPDGTWRHTTYVDFDNAIYPIKIAMTKRGDELTFDLRGTAKQAPATINCTRQSLVAVLRGYVCICLCWDIPWSPSAIGRAVHIISDPGTTVDCEWPAGVSKASTSAAWPVGATVGLLIGKMLACSEKWRGKAMATWQGSMVGEDIFGVSDDGRSYGTTLIDALAGAGGARTNQDGIDTGGYLASMGISVPNVETYEMEYPLLYLTRRQLTDGGGAGRFRGGTSIYKMFMVHGADSIPSFILHCSGAHMPMTGGLCGGHPAGTHNLTVKRSSNIAELLARAVVPSKIEQADGLVEPHDEIVQTTLNRGDLYAIAAMGAGGYGDPLDRSTDLVLTDVLNRIVSKGQARDVYGVIILDDATVDPIGTSTRRAAIRAKRLKVARLPCAVEWAAPVNLTATVQIGESMLVMSDGQRSVMACACGKVLSPIENNYKDYVPQARRTVQSLGPWHDPNMFGSGQFEVREYYCPACARLLDADLLHVDAACEWDVDFSTTDSGLFA